MEVVPVREADVAEFGFLDPRRKNFLTASRS